MHKLILLIAISSLVACSSVKYVIQEVKKSPKSISIINIGKKEHAKAFQMAEKHCAKYYKVPQIVNTSPQAEASMFTMKFRCLKPSK
jgi:hypothetical protein